MKPTKLYQGVRWRHWRKWVVEICLPKNQTRLWLGTFDTIEEAPRGDFARLNFLHLWHQVSIVSGECKPPFLS
ncbi:hypothetical protein UlMin_015574 [Ulmus minor]